MMTEVMTKANITTTDIKFVGTSNLIENTSNDISRDITGLSLETLANGATKKFIVNDQYAGPLKVTQNLTVNGDVTFDSICFLHHFYHDIIRSVTN